MATKWFLIRNNIVLLGEDHLLKDLTFFGDGIGRKVSYASDICFLLRSCESHIVMGIVIKLGSDIYLSMSQVTRSLVQPGCYWSNCKVK